MTKNKNSNEKFLLTKNPQTQDDQSYSLITTRATKPPIVKQDYFSHDANLDRFSHEANLSLVDYI